MKAKFETRELYSQKYMSDEEIHVSSTTYAVLWSLNNNSDPITSRLRVTLLYKKDGLTVSPIQGLIEQWKTEGWTPLDEFADAELTFDGRKEFENHMLTMARSFILGVPLNATITDPDDTPEDPVNTRTFDTKDKRFKSSKIKPLPGIDLKSKDETFEVADPEEANAEAGEEDSDDDDWL